MIIAERVLDLLAHWQAAQDRRERPNDETLCADHPELSAGYYGNFSASALADDVLIQASVFEKNCPDKQPATQKCKTVITVLLSADTAIRGKTCIYFQ